MSTLFIGNNTIRLPIVESTNSYAYELLRGTRPPEGTVVIADEQTQGRGQRGSIWTSEAFKNLTFSLILYPKDIVAEDQFILTQIISLALCDFIECMAGTSCKPNIKWPNDIYVNEKKISGVLIENSLRGNDVTTSVIGIGININQETFEDTGYKATSLKNSCKKEFDLNACYNVLCESIEARYLQYLNKNSDSIKADYHKKLFRLNQVCNFDVGGKTRQGKIIGVSREGKLLLALTEGFTVLELGLKEVKFL